MVYDYLGSNELAATEQPTASPIFAPPARLAVSFFSQLSPPPPLLAPSRLTLFLSLLFIILADRLQTLPPYLVIVGDEEVVLEDSTRWAEALDKVSAPVNVVARDCQWHGKMGAHSSRARGLLVSGVAKGLGCYYRLTRVDGPAVLACSGGRCSHPRGVP